MKWLLAFAVFSLASPCWAQDPRIYWEERSKVIALTDQQLIDCLKGPKNCALDPRYYYVNDIEWVLAKRSHPDLIIAAYKKADDVDRYLLIQTLWYIEDPLVEDFMRSVAFEHPLRDGIDDGSSVFALDYLTQSCDFKALARLNRDVFKKYAVMGCSYLKGPQVAWADAVEAFGRCNYLPAAQNLVRSLDSNCLSTDKAEQSLRQIFPGYCSNPAPMEEKQQCYEKLLHHNPKTEDH